MRKNTTKSPRLERALNGVLTIAGQEMAKTAEVERKRREALAAEIDKALAVLPEETARAVLKALLSVASSTNARRIKDHPMVDDALLAAAQTAREERGRPKANPGEQADTPKPA
jgi:hypothetical protein